MKKYNKCKQSVQDLHNIKEHIKGRQSNTFLHIYLFIYLFFVHITSNLEIFFILVAIFYFFFN